MNDELLVFEEELYHKQGDRKVKGIRIMVTGNFKDLLDKQISSGEFKNYLDVIGAKLKLGINDILSECKDKTMHHG